MSLRPLLPGTEVLAKGAEQRQICYGFACDRCSGILLRIFRFGNRRAVIRFLFVLFGSRINQLVWMWNPWIRNAGCENKAQRSGSGIVSFEGWTESPAPPIF